MQKIVFLGPESSGKSALSQWLSEKLPHGLWLPEYTRCYCEVHGVNTDIEDVKKIAQGQIAQELDALKTASAYVVLDTNLISNYLWSRILFNSVPDVIVDGLAVLQDAYYFVCHPEGLVWEHDVLRCQPQLSERLDFFDQSLACLEQRQLPYQILHGSFEDRKWQLQSYFQSVFF